MSFIVFDGTGDTDKDKQRWTNAVLLREIYAKNVGRDSVIYEEGVGTRYGPIGLILGGGFGLGERDRILHAYNQLCQRWVAGDHIIDLAGFSRGAATILDFMWLLATYGICDPKTGVRVGDPIVRSAVLFDTVASFGFGTIFADDPAASLGHHLILPSNLTVQYAIHAIAIDEDRPAFNVIRVKGADEVVFRGVHSDIGGGNGNLGLSNYSLHWVITKCIAMGLPYTQQDLTSVVGNATAIPQLHPLIDKFSCMWRKFNLVAPTDKRHYSVQMLNMGYPSDKIALMSVESEADELVAHPITEPLTLVISNQQNS